MSSFVMKPLNIRKDHGTRSESPPTSRPVNGRPLPKTPVSCLPCRTLPTPPDLTPATRRRPIPVLLLAESKGIHHGMEHETCAPADGPAVITPNSWSTALPGPLTPSSASTTSYTPSLRTPSTFQLPFPQDNFPKSVSASEEELPNLFSPTHGFPSQLPVLSSKTSPAAPSNWCEQILLPPALPSHPRFAELQRQRRSLDLPSSAVVYERRLLDSEKEDVDQLRDLEERSLGEKSNPDNLEQLPVATLHGATADRDIPRISMPLEVTSNVLELTFTPIDQAWKDIFAQTWMS